MALPSLSSLSIRTPELSFPTPTNTFPKLPSTFKFPPFTTKPLKQVSFSLKSTSDSEAILEDTEDNSDTQDEETIFMQTFADSDDTYEPMVAPEGYIPPEGYNEDDIEAEDDIAEAYEEMYGPAYSGVSVLGGNIYVMDEKVKKGGDGGKVRVERVRDGFEERVVQVRRVTKVVKGGKQMHFRAVVVVGDKQGNVGVGVGKAKEVIGAVQKSCVNARRNVVKVPMTKYSTFPHRADGKFGAASVMLRPASPGTGVIAGGSVRVVLEMAGVENALGKQLGSNNALNNARATVVAIRQMRLFSEVAEDRGIPLEELWK